MASGVAMEKDESWDELHIGEKPSVKVYKAVAETRSELGQRLLGDPLGVLQDNGVLKADDGWSVQLHLSNAHVPTGPLPLPEEITDDFDWGDIWRVIRKIIGILTVLEDLKIVIVVVARIETDRPTAVQAIQEARLAKSGNT